MSTDAWTQKYTPTKMSEVVGNTKGITDLKNFIKNWPNTKKRGLLLIGKSGIGKTSSIYAYAKEHGYAVSEFNASDTRNTQAILEKVRIVATTNTLQVSKKRIILLDEVDGIHGQKERGAASAMVKVLQKSKHPMIFTANEDSQKISAIKRQCIVIYFSRIRDNSVIQRLSVILEDEGIESDVQVLKAIVRNSDGDMRAAINDLQQIAKGRIKLDRSLIQVLKSRDSVSEIRNTIPKIMTARNPFTAIEHTSNIDVDYRAFIMWMYEFAHKWADNADDLAKMYDSISKADRYLNRIIFTQNWKLLRYFYMHLSAVLNVASNKRTSITLNKYSFPMTWAKMSKLKGSTNRRRALLLTLTKSTHTSINKNTQATLPYLQYIFKNDPKMAAEIIYNHKIPKGICKSILDTGKRRANKTLRPICGKEYHIGDKIPSKCRVCGKEVIYVLEPLIGKRELKDVEKEYFAIKEKSLAEQKDVQTAIAEKLEITKKEEINKEEQVLKKDSEKVKLEKVISENSDKKKKDQAKSETIVQKASKETKNEKGELKSKEKTSNVKSTTKLQKTGSKTKKKRGQANLGNFFKK